MGDAGFRQRHLVGVCRAPLQTGRGAAIVSINVTTLSQIAAQYPFPDYQTWWPLGDAFTRFMSNAIIPEWRDLNGQLPSVRGYFTEYIQTVYHREPHPAQVDNFVTGHLKNPNKNSEKKTQKKEK